MNENKSFLDKNTIFALIIVFGILMGWNTYMGKKYPNQNKAPEQTKESNKTTQGEASAQAVAPIDTADAKSAGKKLNPETVTSFENSNFSFEISSLGMGLRNVVLKNYKNRENSAVHLLFSPAGESSFATAMKGTAARIPFTVTEVSSGSWKGLAKVGSVEIEKTLTLDPNNYSFKMTTKATQKGNDVFQGLDLIAKEKALPAVKGSMFSPPLEKQEFVVVNLESSKGERVVFNTSTDIDKKFSKVRMVGINYLYFASMLVDNSQVSPDAQVISNKENGVAAISYSAIPGESELQITNTIFVGPKDLENLNMADPILSRNVDFGIFAAIAKPLLALLKTLNKFFNNFGFSIIFLTLIVRLFVLPFNIMSFKSMKAMQLIKPQMDAIRANFKDNPQLMNQKVMQLMREKKVNPAGGCLPMLLQLPVFIALYSLLAHSIELYQAPFIFWIHDLSLKDPFYVLPALMGIAMFIQQKITPSTIDPAQAKVMQFMPILFTFLMSGLPSGLTLYIFVSTLFGVTQQKIFLQDKKK